MLQRIDVEIENPQALIIAPTRELCLQIAGDLADYSKYISNLRVLPVYGGSSIESQIKMLRRGVHIVVATPGRLLDLIKRVAQKGITMLIVTHEMAFAREVATKVFFMAEGKILEQGTPAEIFDNPKTERLKDFLSKVL